jgi:putative PIN family toxin of toxin-antitoxin system
MLVVLDTNVVVSGLLNKSGKPAKVLDLALEGRLQLAYDNRIFGEYEDVLARPELHIHPARAQAIISYLELAGKFVNASPLSTEGYSDPGDLPFVEVFISTNAEALVTGNLRHFAPLMEKGSAVFNPSSFLENFFPKG